MNHADVNYKTIVRVVTIVWYDDYYIHQDRQLFIGNQSNRYIQHDLDTNGVYDVVSRIVNFNTVEDGLYEVVINDLREYCDNPNVKIKYRLIEYDTNRG